ncbi:enoyl-CoA hydratase/isomerase family protein [Nocardioides sp. B-3]|uniref:enoyl-CoA hydratase/isomerase family protein n=1 Tax=Nocardioides sp. B-3 TaxID=2895565 RepID=UPI002153A741|nr:enoyl-CoA hydratase-related protein [Nocardioides sp. B-3]UUZ59527.1 enoyl-CoA hydratase-related protein [Nocardioides sp. B-3]
MALELALHCDLVIASSRAGIGDGHMNYGLLPGAGGAARLPRVIGPTRAKYLAFTGELLSAEQAMTMGLVVEVVAPDELQTRAEELSLAIARRSPSALRLFKQAIDDGPGPALAERHAARAPRPQRSTCTAATCTRGCGPSPRSVNRTSPLLERTMTDNAELSDFRIAVRSLARKNFLEGYLERAKGGTYPATTP